MDSRQQLNLGLYLIGAIVIFLLVWGIWNSYNRGIAAHNFCQNQNITYYSGFYYCDGKPYICNSNKCDYIQKTMVVN